jgi:hypothetical protein
MGLNPNQKGQPMGWLYTEGQTRRQLIDNLTREWETADRKGSTYKRYCSGNTLFTVTEIVNKHSGEIMRYIGVYLLQREQNYGWGYKDMDESMGPYQYGCPLSFFDLVPDPGGYATEWRKRNRENHARRFQKLELHQRVKLTNGQWYKIVSLRPLRATDEVGCTYRVPRRMLTTEKEIFAYA